jgi:uncharacterized protein (TIGR03437 family)
MRVCLFTALAATLGHSATLSIPGQTLTAGNTALLSVTLASQNQAISAVQFDLSWSTPLSVAVAGGSQVGGASKMLNASLLQPSTVRFLISGMNQSTLSDGEVLRIFVTTPAGAAPGIGQLTLRNLSAAGPDGSSVTLQGNGASIQVQAGSLTQIIQPSGIVNGASFAPGPISPGEVVTLFGSFPSTPVILFNGVRAPMIYSSVTQVVVVVPYGLDISNPAQVQIQSGGTIVTLGETSVPVAAASPAIFTLSTTGTGPGAILNQDYSVNTYANPAARGSVLMVYATGFGALNPLPPDGQLATVLATPSSPVSAMIDGVPAEVIYAGAAPGLINGAIQVNVRVPDGVRSNPAAAISISMDSFVTQPGVTVAIR